jgi:hypothetical protein
MGSKSRNRSPVSVSTDLRIRPSSAVSAASAFSAASTQTAVAESKSKLPANTDSRRHSVRSASSHSS